MKVDTLNLNVLNALKKRIIQLEERCLADIGQKISPKDYRFISINENDICLDFDVQCEVSDAEVNELISKIEDYSDGFFKVIYLGDIAICTKRAREQAREYNHSYKREVCFLALHGFLHIMGYDHIEKEDEKEMMSLAEKILKKVNLGR